LAGSFFFEIGVVIFLAFLGAYIAGRFRQSVIVGYIIVGILIGPGMAGFNLGIGGFHYTGLVSNREFIQQISRLGLMFLLFFTGLGFSASALKSTWKPAVMLAVSDVLINIYVGFIIGSIFGWPLPDTIFLAAIIGMSSVAVAAKSAEDHKQLYRKELNYLFSTMIVEDFISILLLTFASAFVLGNILSTEQLVSMGMGVVIIYAFFFVLAVFIAPRAFHYFERIQGDELFVLFALSVVFLSSAFADFMGIPPAIGAFLVGMAFAETRLKDKLHSQMLSMKDAFVAIFFVSFGMLVDPRVFLQVAPMIALAVPLVIMNEVFILGCLAYFVGFTRRAAISIGTGFLGRGEDAVMFASVGSGLQNPATGEKVLTRAGEISPFTGAFCFVMSGITPFMMKHALAISDRVSGMLPRSLKFGGTLIARTLKGVIMSSGFSPSGFEKRLMALLLAYGVSTCVSMVSSGITHIVAAAAGLVLLVLTWRMFSSFLKPRAASLDLQDLNVLQPDRSAARMYVTNTVILLLSMVLVTTTFWSYSWLIAVVINIAIVLSIIAYMKYIYMVLKVKPPPMGKEHMLRAGPSPRATVEPYFGPRKTRAKFDRPMRSVPVRREFQPVPKGALIPAVRARRKGDEGD
jgi:CPA2 family monovalent cation:H+ antiporter-2